MLAIKYFQNIIILVIMIAGISLNSCTTTRIVTKYDSDTFANNPLHQRTTWSFLWGLVQPKDINPQCDARFNHLDQVTIKNNLGFSLISVVSLGIVMPQRIEWDCAPYSPTTDSLGHN